MTTSDGVDDLASTLWSYLRMGRRAHRCEAILALGSMDVRVAEHAARLFLDGYAPLLICSGGFGRLTGSAFTQPEADVFAAVARRAGVPAASILVENKSTNTKENLLFTSELLTERGQAPKSFLVVTTPILERRAYATFKKQWPDGHAVALITSPDITLQAYPTPEQPRDAMLEIMVGEVRRLREYAARGWVLPQDMPEAVWEASERLAALGYDRHAIPISPPEQDAGNGEQQASL